MFSIINSLNSGVSVADPVPFLPDSNAGDPKKGIFFLPNSAKYGVKISNLNEENHIF